MIPVAACHIMIPGMGLCKLKGCSVKENAGYEPVDHTADVAMRVWAPDLRELLLQAAKGFIDLMIDPATVRAETARQIVARGADAEDLLVGWLEEIHYVFEAGRFAPCEVEITEFEGDEVRGLVRGEALDPERQEVRQVVKAITYHSMDIKQTDGRYEVEIVFDV